MGQPVLNGCSKSKQLDEFSRYFDWEKDGNSYIITEIYNEPLPKMSSSQLSEDIYNCLLFSFYSFITDNPKGYTSISLTKKQMMEFFGMVGRQYFNAKQYYESVCHQKEQREMPYPLLEREFFYSSYNIIYKALNYALKILEKNKNIILNKEFVKISHQGKPNEKYETGNEQDMAMYTESIGRALRSLGYSCEQEAILHDKYEDVMSLARENLKKIQEEKGIALKDRFDWGINKIKIIILNSIVCIDVEKVLSSAIRPELDIYKDFRSYYIVSINEEILKRVGKQNLNAKEKLEKQLNDKWDNDHEFAQYKKIKIEENTIASKESAKDIATKYYNIRQKYTNQYVNLSFEDIISVLEETDRAFERCKKEPKPKKRKHESLKVKE